MRLDYLYFKRVFDLIFSSIALILLSPLMLMIALIIAGLDGLPIMYSSKRIGGNSRVFQMPKFRTMKPETPAVATDLLKNPDTYMTFLGPFLRQTSLDELPQLWSILIGDMSLVGPRPCLFNQKRLISERKKRGVFQARPGITGLA